ncbi:quinolinate synthase NadA [Candidatus Pyrohabitans sp.]
MPATGGRRIAKLERRIEKLKEEHNAVIVAHNFQQAEVQDLADFVGNKLECALFARQSDASVVVACGIDFMAELIAILNPDKRVLIPSAEARCPMVAMVSVEQIAGIKERSPEAKVVGYIKARAEQYAACDYICNHSKALRLLRKIEGKAIFLPDQYVGSYLRNSTGKDLIIAEGYCPPHVRILPGEVSKLKEAHTNAEVLIHPQCRGDVLALADHVLDTQQMVERVRASSSEEFIVATEIGMKYRLEKEFPEKRFYFPSERASCSNHKITDAAKVLWCLEDLAPEVRVPEEIAEKARRAMRAGGML